MFSKNNFKDEKFRDTIKKNFCRLKQKSSFQLGEHIISQTKPNYQYKNQNEDRINQINNNIIQENMVNNKLMNFNISKIYKKRQMNSTLEEKQINKKKNVEGNSEILSLKQRILMKLKEQRNERKKNEETSENKNALKKETPYKNFINIHKRIIHSNDINSFDYKNNVSVGNNITKKDFLNTINNDGKNKDNINIKINLDKKLVINRNYKNFSSQGNRTIYNIKTSDSKFNNNIQKSNVVLLTNNEKNIIDENKGFLKFSNPFLTDQINKFGFETDRLNENSIINKKIKNDIDNQNKIIIAKKPKNYFDEITRKILRKNEEEQNKINHKEQTEKNVILNKTVDKTKKIITLFDNDFESNEIKQIKRKKDKMITNKSITLLNNRSLRTLNGSEEYNYKSKIEEEKENDIIKKKKSQKKNIYLAIEKPKLFSKSILFKHLMINTDYNNINEYNKKTMNKNINKLKNINDINESKEEEHKNNNDINKSTKININFIRNYKSPTKLISRNNINAYNEEFKNNNYFKKLTETSKKPQELYKFDYIIKMIIEAIQLKNSIEIYSLFSILLINFNNKYIVSFSLNKFSQEVYPFLNYYKYLSISIVPLIFFYKDENIYKINIPNVKNLFENIIYIFINRLGQKAFINKKINSFLEEFKKNEKNFETYDSMENCCLELIKTVFKNNIKYIPLKKASDQLLNMSQKESLEKVIHIINNTILFCFNHKEKNNFYLLTQINRNTNYAHYITNKNSNLSVSKVINKPTAPYIRTNMKKNFCLVLDLDETILHTMNLPFQNYFLLRPGVIGFLEEISKLYEIIIFTSSPKSYADPLLNKIDIDNKYFSHRLYKEHVIFEKGKSVKNLNLIGRDLNKIIFVDNMKCNAKYNLKNLYLISSWTQNINDEELIKLQMKLKYIATSSKFKDDITKGLQSPM